MIKMIVTDLDGTLFRVDKSISNDTKLILKRCREAGIKVVYATGRGGSAHDRAPSELFDGCIVMNGAVARLKDDIVYTRLIPYLIAKPLLLACHKRGMKISSEISEWHYSNFVVSDEWPEITNFTMVDFERHDKDAEKIYAIHVTETDAEFIEHNLPDELHLVMARDNFAQVTHKEATKAKAAIELMRIWRIDQSEVVAFGDDLNDIEMLRYAGIGVAMGNALDEVKAVADYGCDTNDNDGVATWIEENVLRMRC